MNVFIQEDESGLIYKIFTQHYEIYKYTQQPKTHEPKHKK